MDFEKFNKFGSLLLKDEFVLSYSGYASEDVLHSMGETLRQRLGDHTDDKGKIKHVFSVFVELMQNLIRYGAEGPHPTPKTGDRQAFGLIMVVQNGTTIEVMSCNYVSIWSQRFSKHCVLAYTVPVKLLQWDLQNPK